MLSVCIGISFVVDDSWTGGYLLAMSVLFEVRRQRPRPVMARTAQIFRANPNPLPAELQCWGARHPAPGHLQQP